MKIILLLVLVGFLAGGCAYQRSYEIALPPGPSSTTVQSAPPTVVPPTGQIPAAPAPPRVEVWRPDPTLGIVKNLSNRIFKKYWIDSRPPSPPTLELAPETSHPVHLMLGGHPVHIEGRMKTQYGWVSVGAISRTIQVRSRSYGYGGYNWELVTGDGDFPR